MSRHQLPGNHGNPLTLADGLRSNDSQEIWVGHGGGAEEGRLGEMAQRVLE